MAISIALRADAVRSLGWRRLLILGSLVAVAVTGGLLALSRSPLFEVRSIRVTGASALSAREVRATLGIGPGASILWVDTAAAEARLEADPRVARATVGRALPWTLTIDVEERSPVAVVRTPAGDLLVAGDGTVLGPGARRARLPRILVPAAQLSRGARPVDVAALARVVRTLPPGVRAAVATVATDATGSVVLRIAGGPRVVFGVPDDVHAKTTALREVLAWARRARVELRAISVVSPTAPAAVVVSS